MDKKNFLRYLIVMFFFITTCLMPAMSKAQGDQKVGDIWDWTKKNLNPTWMEWGEKYYPTNPVRGGYLRTASQAYIGLMNPNHWPVNDWPSISLFYEGITAYDGNYRQTVCWLMDSFEYENPTTLIMKLKKGVKFHDGTDFNAHSLKYLFDWIGNPKNGCWTRGQQKRIKSLEALDDYTLKWATYKPWGSFPQGFFAFQISEKALRGDVALREEKKAQRDVKSAENRLEKDEEKYTEAQTQGGEAAEKAARKLEKAKKALADSQARLNAALEEAKGHKSTDVYPVGTGPYMLEEAKPGNYLQVKRNPNWWFGRSIGRPEMPYFDGVKVTVIPDPSIQLANLRAGSIDTMVLSKAQYQMVKNDPKLRVYTYPNNTTTLLLFNQANGPAKDIRVREAVSHAIDRQALIAGVQFGMAREASCLYPDDHWAHNPDLKPVKYDPDLSKKLLAEAGFENGLTLRGVNYNYNEAVTLGEAVKQMLANVGIKWQVDVLDSVAVTDKMRNLEYDLAVSAAPYIQDPDASVSYIYHPDGGFYFNRNDDPELINLIESGRYETDPEKRQKIYYRIEDRLYKKYMDVWLFYDVAAVAYRKNVEGYNNQMFIQNRTLYTYSHPLWFKDGKP